MNRSNIRKNESIRSPSMPSQKIGLILPGDGLEVRFQEIFQRNSLSEQSIRIG
ncbi:hypothetical protein LEP1GSC060_3325 [Leptospira weilii serovar Ranarum str. ICFT]|uniref:Uncharacterized protein n=1 Tax=Leptospira weilii serovar Ranarum str. ICFT TaxID=1218598 RepID=N1WMM7_9LEPT|nr:hypothetical protein LEP1GSC060_3325 [Leptospira weilii serovar Ranarum str. ICFT]